MKLELYKFDTCPYCVRVFDAIKRLGRTDIEMHDVMKNEDDFKRLMEKSAARIKCRVCSLTANRFTRALT